MLMPILTVKPAAAPAHAAAVVETVTPRERAPVLPPIRISGSQSEAVLKILETLNRHLIGSEPLPKEALIRLLDTLAKVLKFPPLPQETLRDFSKRLAVFLETLPPAARLAVEKQLGQRNLAVSLRILSEALKTPLLLETPRLPDRAFTPLIPGRPYTTQTEGRPTPALPFQQQPAQGTLTGRQTPLPAAQALQHITQQQQAFIAAAFVPDPGLLQAALKKAFGDDDDTVAALVIAVEEHEADQETAAVPHRQDDATKTLALRGTDTTATVAQARVPAAKTNAETIPLLRAAAAFLAAHPEAMSLVAAIATGDIDSRVKTKLEQELGLDLSEPADVTELATQSAPAEEPQDTPDQATRLPVESDEKPLTQAAVESKPERRTEPGTGRQSAPSASQMLSRQAPLAHLNPTPGTLFIDESEIALQSATPLAKPTLVRNSTEVEGFKGHDLGEWELEATPELQAQLQTEESQPKQFESQESHIDKVLAQTLKALVEASLPLPDGSVDWAASDALFTALAGETADMGAQALFAELEATDDAAMLPDTALFTGNIGDGAEPLALEADTLNALIDTPEERNANHLTFGQSAMIDEPGRDAQVPRLPDAGIARDAIPFAMIPYLPANIPPIKSRKHEDEDEEQPAFSGQHEQERGESHERPEDREQGNIAASPAEPEDDDSETGDAYDLYRRMGGLG
jgi:hypothetical protein